MMKNDKEQMILEAAVKVLSQKGFEGATTKEIAQEAGIAEATLFRYFSTKKGILEQILFKVVDTVIPKLFVNSLEIMLLQYSRENLKETLRMILKNRLNLIGENFNLFKIVMTEAQFNQELRQAAKDKIFLPIRQLVKQYIEKGITAGFLRPVDASAASRFVSYAFWGLIMEHNLLMDEEQPRDIDDEINEIIDIFLYGIGKVEQ